MSNRSMALVCATLVAVACGGGDDDGDDDGGDGAADRAFPIDLAVASPTASGVASASARRLDRTDPGSPAPRATAISVGMARTYADKLAELDGLVHGSAAGDCLLILSGPMPGFNPSCYGPQLDYVNHPDASGGPADGQLPSGDLGLWRESEPGGEACASAKLNSLVDDVAARSDYGLYLAAAMICEANVAGMALPDEDDALDLTALLEANLSSGSPGVTVSQATLGREPDADGRTVYRFDGELAIDGPWTGNLSQAVASVADSGEDTAVTFAWQAGEGDGLARVFNVAVSGPKGSAEGCGFFGFGPGFVKSSATAADNTIDRFICNWAGPMNQHAGLADHGQKQCMSDASGVFAATESHLTYAPINACDSTGAVDFGYKEVGAPDYETAPLVSDLVDLTTDADFAAFVAPVAPD